MEAGRWGGKKKELRLIYSDNGSYNHILFIHCAGL